MSITFAERRELREDFEELACAVWDWSIASTYAISMRLRWECIESADRAYNMARQAWREAEGIA